MTGSERRYPVWRVRDRYRFRTESKSRPDWPEKFLPAGYSVDDWARKYDWGSRIFHLFGYATQHGNRSIAIVFGGYENTDRLPHYGVS